MSEGLPCIPTEKEIEVQILWLSIACVADEGLMMFEQPTSFEIIAFR